MFQRRCIIDRQKRAGAQPRARETRALTTGDTGAAMGGERAGRNEWARTRVLPPPPVGEAHVLRLMKWRGSGKRAATARETPASRVAGLPRAHALQRAGALARRRQCWAEHGRLEGDGLDEWPWSCVRRGWQCSGEENSGMHVQAGGRRIQRRTSAWWDGASKTLAEETWVVAGLCAGV